MKRLAFIPLLALILVPLLPTDASAITAWARKYKQDCSVCHAGPMYKLTPMGAEFLRRGHRMADDEPTVNLAELISVNTKLRVHDSNAAGRNSTFEVHAFSLYTGGVIAKRWSYFTEFYMYENTGRTTAAVNGDLGRSKLADAYLMFNSTPEKTTYTTVKLGQISPSQMLIYWNVGPRFSETRPYIVNNSTVAPNTYRPFVRNFGVEVAQTIKNFHAAAGVLNGTGSGVTNSIDNNESKDFYGSADFALDNQGSAVGVYGYQGKGLITPSTGTAWENAFNRAGAFGQYVKGPLNLTAAYTRGTEQINSAGLETHNVGGLFEADYVVTEKFGVFGRYDYFDPNDDLGNDHISGPVAGATYRFIELGRAVFEYHKQGKRPAVGAAKPWEYRLEVAFMF